jgi:hypothetical protein
MVIMAREKKVERWWKESKNKGFLGLSPWPTNLEWAFKSKKY